VLSHRVGAIYFSQIYTEEQNTQRPIKIAGAAPPPPPPPPPRAPAVVSGAIEKLGITYPVALDPELAAFQTYGATAWPTHYIAGADGQLREVGRGTKGVEDQIRALLAEAGATLPD